MSTFFQLIALTAICIVIGEIKVYQVKKKLANDCH